MQIGPFKVVEKPTSAAAELLEPINHCLQARDHKFCVHLVALSAQFCQGFAD
jgi:hypothetical protein